MIYKLALAHFFSVFFDGRSRCRWLMSAQILEPVDVTIVSPSALVAGSEFFDLPNLCSLDPA